MAPWFASATTDDPWYGDPTKDQQAVTVRFWQPPVNLPENQMIGIRYTAQVGDQNNLGPFVTRQPAWLFNGVLASTTQLQNLMGYEADAHPLPPPANIITVAISNANGCTCAYTTVYQPNPGNNPTVFGAGTMQWSWGLDNHSVDFFEKPIPQIDNATFVATPQMTQNIFSQFCGSQACH